MIPADTHERLMKDQSASEKLTHVLLLCLRQVLDGRGPEEGVAR
jgi:hypothetical protein